MLTNAQMKSNRYGRWADARKRVAEIQEALRAGKVVLLCSYTKPLQFEGAKHVDSFKATRSGAYVKRGKNWDCIDYTPVKFRTWQKETV